MTGQMVDAGIGLRARPTLKHATLRTAGVCCRGRHHNAEMVEWGEVAMCGCRWGLLTFGGHPRLSGRWRSEMRGDLRWRLGSLHDASFYWRKDYYQVLS